MKVTICGRTEEETKEKIQQEAPLRGHTPSEAVDHILKLGMPLYLKQFPKVFRRIDEKSRATA